MSVRAQAHETGICAIREELYSQCFDEVRMLTAPHVELPFLQAPTVTAAWLCAGNQAGNGGLRRAGAALAAPA